MLLFSNEEACPGSSLFTTTLVSCEIFHKFTSYIQSLSTLTLSEIFLLKNYASAQMQRLPQLT